jgi:16S rRNA (uracil1498-N3)-methyltransferase
MTLLLNSLMLSLYQDNAPYSIMIPHLYVHYGFNLTDSIPLSAPQHHYLSKVMRLKSHDVVHIFNGNQGLWRAHLDGMTLIKACPLAPQPPQPPTTALFFSPIKAQNWLIEKAVELGVTDFFPILCRRTTVRHFCPKRHMKIVHEACEQSRRWTIPTIHPIMPLTTYVSPSTPQGCDFFACVLMLDAAMPMSQMNPMARGFFVGPEGGWSPEEVALFAQNPHITPVHLGSAVLRAETAALVASTLILHTH